MLVLVLVLVLKWIDQVKSDPSMEYRSVKMSDYFKDYFKIFSFNYGHTINVCVGGVNC